MMIVSALLLFASVFSALLAVTAGTLAGEQGTDTERGAVYARWGVSLACTGIVLGFVAGVLS